MSELAPLPVTTSPPKERVAYLDNARYSEVTWCWASDSLIVQWYWHESCLGVSSLNNGFEISECGIVLAWLGVVVQSM